MSATNEQLVARIQAGDDSAVAPLLERNRGIICRAILRYQPLAEQECFDDLVQVGEIATWRAALRFEPARGLKFSTLLWHCVRHSIRQEIDRHATIYANTQNGYGLEDKRRTRRPLRIDDRNEMGFGHDLPADDDAATDAGRCEEHALLAWAISRLPERRRAVMQGRLAGRTLDKIGADQGISKERVRQIQDEARAAVSALVLANANGRPTGRLASGEKEYIRLVRTLRPPEVIACDLRRPVARIKQELAKYGRWKKLRNRLDTV